MAKGYAAKQPGGILEILQYLHIDFFNTQTGYIQYFY